MELNLLRVRRMRLFFFFLHLTAISFNGLERDLVQASFRAPVHAQQEFRNTRFPPVFLCVGEINQHPLSALCTRRGSLNLVRRASFGARFLRGAEN